MVRELDVLFDNQQRLIIYETLANNYHNNINDEIMQLINQIFTEYSEIELNLKDVLSRVQLKIYGFHLKNLIHQSIIARVRYIQPDIDCE